MKNRHIRDDQTSLTSFGIAGDFVGYSAKALMEDEQLMLNASKVIVKEELRPEISLLHMKVLTLIKATSNVFL